MVKIFWLSFYFVILVYVKSISHVLCFEAIYKTSNKSHRKKLESRIHQDGENMRMKEQTNGLRGIQNLSIVDAK